MRKGCLLGILKKGMSSYSSPIILIPRKLSGIPRIVTDFRHLNSRLVTLQPSIPLVRDAIQILGASGCEILSLADLRDAYLKREEAYLTIATVSKLFKHLEFVSQHHPDYNSFQDLITIMFQGLVERKIAPAMVYHWLTH